MGRRYTDSMSPRPQFLFITCQVGAEKAVKGEPPRCRPHFPLRLFPTRFLDLQAARGLWSPAGIFRAPCHLRPDFWFFAGAGHRRRSGHRWPKNAWALFAGPRPWDQRTRRQRDTALAGVNTILEPPPAQRAKRPTRPFADIASAPQRLADEEADRRQPARPGAVGDGLHLARPGAVVDRLPSGQRVPSQWPGGLMPLVLPPQAISRAWLKMEEALRWAQLPIPQGARWAEIGSAPGGSSQALVERGYYVTGIDPAVMDPAPAWVIRVSPIFAAVRARCPGGRCGRSAGWRPI